jgi:hypothetical protein
MDTPHSKHKHLFAVVRYDLPVDSEHPENSIAVVKVLSNREAAGVEAARLRTINGGKGCT